MIDDGKLLDEAIAHCYEIAVGRDCGASCASDHIQLANWLTELKERRAEDKDSDKQLSEDHAMSLQEDCMDFRIHTESRQREEYPLYNDLGLYSRKGVPILPVYRRD